MSEQITTESGADVRIYRFRDFLGAGSAAKILTEFSHVLTDEDRTGFTGYGDDMDEHEYPPAAMAIEMDFTHTGDLA
jgi:hypothetical protein